MHKRFKKYLKQSGVTGWGLWDSRMERMLYNAWQAGRRHGKLESHFSARGYHLENITREKLTDTINDMYARSMVHLHEQVIEWVKENADV